MVFIQKGNASYNWIVIFKLGGKNQMKFQKHETLFTSIHHHCDFDNSYFKSQIFRGETQQA